MSRATADTEISPKRYLSAEDRAAFTPVHVVWEITLACDLKCLHCGSRAGKIRPNELSTSECLDLVRQLARLGTREVTLIGGEAYLRRDWIEIIREITGNGMHCSMQSGGLHLDKPRIRAAAKAGLVAAGISIDGLPELHDRIRGVKGSYKAGFAALRMMRDCGIRTSVNTQITSEVIPQLPELMERFIEAGASNWQVQLTVAMGRAADNSELLLQPYQLLELMPLLAKLYEEGADRGLLLQPGNNIGYFGPFESLWRGSGDERFHWTGCNAGQNTMGIEADGTIKGCPSLATSTYAGGNIRDLSVDTIWRETPQLGFTRRRSTGELWGFCRTCYYAETCHGGCTWTTHSLLNRSGNNPYCHHRTLELSERGLRERIVQVEKAPGLSFDHGRFELVLEQLDKRTETWKPVSAPADNPVAMLSNQRRAVLRENDAGSNLVTLTSALNRSAPARGSRAAVQALVVCRGCSRYVRKTERVCPFCHGNISALARTYRRRLTAAKRIQRRLEELIYGPTLSK